MERFLKGILVAILYCLVLVSFATFACDAEYMVISDLHLDPELKTSMPFEPRQKGADTDLPTFMRMFDKIRTFYLKNTISGVITLGDFVGHNVSAQKRKDIQAFLYDKFSELNTAVYYGFGNNDSLFGNYQAYAKNNKSSYTLLKNRFPNLVSGFVYDESLSKCASLSNTKTCLYHENKHLGHYSVQLQPGLRLINMNTVVFNGDYYFNDQLQTAEALNWLRNELNDATSKKDSVVVAMHVPPGIDLYSGHFHFREKWLKRNTFQKQFMAIIHNALDNDLNLIGMLAGHTHHDEIHIIKHPKKNVPVFINPALSTLHGNAAAFKTLCLKRSEQYWELENIKGYSLATGKRYTVFPNDLCLDNSISVCLAMLIKTPDKLLSYVKQNYFAANPNQVSKLKTKSQYLISQ